MIGFVILREQLVAQGKWPELPHVPGLLGASTVVLIISSVPMHLAIVAAKRDNAPASRRMIALTIVLGVAFMILQTLAAVGWFRVAGDLWNDTPEARAAVSTFYVLTGLHGAHVLGGFIVLGLTYHGTYREGGVHPPSVARGAAYWHFLDVTWVCLFLLLIVW